jgi:hypothetical protein
MLLAMSKVILAYPPGSELGRPRLTYDMAKLQAETGAEVGFERPAGYFPCGGLA